MGWNLELNAGFRKNHHKSWSYDCEVATHGSKYGLKCRHVTMREGWTSEFQIQGIKVALVVTLNGC